MKKILLTLSLFAFSAALMAQDDINLLDLVADQPTTKAADTLQVAPEATDQNEEEEEADLYDWRTHRHSVAFTWGAPSMFDGSLVLIEWIVTLGQEDHTHYAGPFSVEYGYNALRWLRVGGRLSYEYAYCRGYEPVYHVFRASGRLDFTYINKEHVRLYSGFEIGAGMSYNHYPTINEKDFVKPLLVLGMCPIGVEAGGKRVFFKAEFNLGSTEFFRTGIGVRL